MTEPPSGEHEAADREPADQEPVEAEAAAPPPWERWTAIALLVVPLLGIMAHAVVYFLATEGSLSAASLRAYVFGWATKAVAMLAVACVVGNWIHYRRTRMRLDVASRIAAYLWILSIVLLFKAVQVTR